MSIPPNLTFGLHIQSHWELRKKKDFGSGDLDLDEKQYIQCPLTPNAVCRI